MYVPNTFLFAVRRLVERLDGQPSPICSPAELKLVSEWKHKIESSLTELT